MELHTRFHLKDGLTIAVVQGEIDIATVQRFSTDLSRGLALSTRGMVVDLTGVGFMDASGLSALVHARNSADLRGRRLTLFAPRPQLRKLLRLIGPTEPFDIEPRLRDDGERTRPVAERR
jgi:anti-anti-sigma factor